MEDMGLADFHQFAYSLDADRLIEQFRELEGRHAQVQQKMADRNAAHARELEGQFIRLSAMIFPGEKPDHVMAASKSAG